MRFDKLKLITASTLILLGSQSGNVWAEDNTASQAASQVTSTAAAPATAQTQTNTVQTPQPAYQGYQYPRYKRAYRRPFGGRGSGFHAPWNRGRGSGFGFSSNDGPDWDPDTGFGPWGDRDQGFYDRGPRFEPWDDRERGFYDRGPTFRGPWDRGNGSGMGFGW